MFRLFLLSVRFRHRKVRCSARSPFAASLHLPLRRCGAAAGYSQKVWAITGAGLIEWSWIPTQRCRHLPRVAYSLLAQSWTSPHRSPVRAVYSPLLLASQLPFCCR